MSPAVPRTETSRVKITFIELLLLGQLAQRSTSSASRAGVGQQRHLAGVLHAKSDETLFLGGNTGHPASADLAAIRDELAQERGVLVVDVLDLRRLERVGLLLGLAHYGLGHRGALHFLRGAQSVNPWDGITSVSLVLRTEPSEEPRWEPQPNGGGS